MLTLTTSVPSADASSTLRVSPFFEGTESHENMVGDLALEAARIRFEGKIGDVLWMQEGVGQFQGFVGAGKPETRGALRRTAFQAVQLARQLKAERLVLDVGTSLSAAQAVALVEGLLLSAYSFDTYKKAKSEEERIGELREIVVAADASLQAALERGRILAEAVCFARNLSNEQPGVCTPTWFTEQGRAKAEAYGVEARVFDEIELEEKGFGLHLAVARASDEPARLLHAIYRGEGPITRKIALVGKGVTFDSGGYSLKPGDSMLDMHMDMGGGAAVMGALDAIAQLKPQGVEIHFIVPSAENMVSGSGYRLNEVVRAYNGTTVEILNTDAEGRLLLADAIAYAVDQGVEQIIDLATLTGACVVALGNETAGLMTPSEDFRTEIEGAARRADELLWSLPLVERMQGQLRSRVADLKNVGARWGGAISAAMFLQKFVGETEWAHIDLAGPAMADAAWEYICAGGTGYGVLTLVELLAGDEAY